jgi:transcriptional regulator with XRE-family HTH domain
MQSGAQQLAEWIRRRSEKKREIAELFGISAGYLSMFLSGERAPGREVALRIYEFTGIPVGAWSLRTVHDSDLVAVSSASKSKRNKA